MRKHNSTLKSKALFLDRDGVINKDYGYVHKVEDFHFIEGIFSLCQKAQNIGYKIIVITNQAGIGRGYYTEQEFEALTLWMNDQFATKGIKIAGVYYCPHHPEHAIGEYLKKCDCRKPMPGLIVKAAKEHSINLAKSIMIGDKDTDQLAAENAKVGKFIKFSSYK